MRKLLCVIVALIVLSGVVMAEETYEKIDANTLKIVKGDEATVYLTRQAATDEIDLIKRKRQTLINRRNAKISKFNKLIEPYTDGINKYEDYIAKMDEFEITSL